MYDVVMPKLSDTMEVGKIIQWKVKEGDEVHEGDVLAEVESDKAVMELECFHDGVLANIVHGDDAEVPVGEVIAFIAPKGEEPAKQPPEREKPEPHKAEAPPPEVKARPVSRLAPVARRESRRVAISPYARKLAEQKGIDYTQLRGTGPDGRITARDVEGAASAKAPVAEKLAKIAELKRPALEGKPEPVAPALDMDPLVHALLERYSVDPSTVSGTGTGSRITVDDAIAALTGKRPGKVKASPDEELPALEVTEEEAEIEEASFRLKTQARRVTASKHVIPHFYVTRGVDVARLLDVKDELKEKYGATVTHLVMLACLKTLGKHPEINRSYDRGRIIKWKGINLGLAIDTEDGLTVAVIRDAQNLTLKEIIERTAAMVVRARAGELTAEERRHPTFTITNLGMFDVEHFEPIVNPPSSVTLAVSSALPAPVVRGEAIYITKVMKLTASCDHRIIDGVAAASFLKDLSALLENPDELLG